PAPGILDVSGHPRLEELCLAADALITDYAPVLFDYANLDRPIVVHAADWEAYRAVHGAYFDLPAVAPGPVTRTEEELLAALAGPGLWTDPRYAALRAEFRRRFCPYDDGLAAERVVRRFFLDGAGVPPVVPPEARRPAPGAVLVRATAPRPRSGHPIYTRG
ncbi:CDP-glycerol glycerophosphotransferase family protein, partial [Streptomyces sp. URMC 129]|uniref:CDP-glycerol glycerophosphotransferase family protein n=1 Tax=Streptomyces sp. URMC 129 TaxID=3423407 RepID=UPI003F1DEB34